MIIIRSPLCAFIKKNADTQRAFYRTSYKVKIKTSYNIALRITALKRNFALGRSGGGYTETRGKFFFPRPFCFDL